MTMRAFPRPSHWQQTPSGQETRLETLVEMELERRGITIADDGTGMCWVAYVEKNGETIAGPASSFVQTLFNALKWELKRLTEDTTELDLLHKLAVVTKSGGPDDDDPAQMDVSTAFGPLSGVLHEKHAWGMTLGELAKALTVETPS